MRMTDPAVIIFPVAGMVIPLHQLPIDIAVVVYGRAHYPVVHALLPDIPSFLAQHLLSLGIEQPENPRVHINRTLLTILLPQYDQGAFDGRPALDLDERESTPDAPHKGFIRWNGEQ